MSTRDRSAPRSAPQPDSYLVRFTDTPQGRMRSRTLGPAGDEAPHVVAVQGMAVSEYLLPALTALSDRARTHLVDLPGLAGSGPATELLDVPGYAAAVTAWLDAADLPPVVLVGHSSSTQVVARVAVARPRRVRALVLASPTVDPAVRSWPRLILQWRRDSRYPLPGLQQQHTPEWVRAGARQLRNLVSVHLRDHLEDVIGAVRCPVLVLRGEHDEVSTESWARSLADLAPEGRFEAVPGPHTFVWSHPTAWCTPIHDLISRAWDAPAQG
ncbi:alpha/beta fold hydrolase [Saccharopolyspora cebuensis]|uniref:Alpha/beta fold hydrolase n=1 Tax=Saccharopolyspora cebuensis TaxID=418759 RepID=A0ABV4CAN3_9PSEU